MANNKLRYTLIRVYYEQNELGSNKLKTEEIEFKTLKETVENATDEEKILGSYIYI